MDLIHNGIKGMVHSGDVKGHEVEMGGWLTVYSIMCFGKKIKFKDGLER